MISNPKRLAAALLAISAIAACHNQPTAQPQQQESAQAAEAISGKGVDRSDAGKALPDTEILNPDGDQASLPDPDGKPMLVNLWASWCAPCVKELPTLQALSERPGAPQVVEVSEDVGPRASIDAFFKSHGITKLDSWQDPKMVMTTALGAEVLPTSVYYDASGKEVWRYVGDLDWTSPEAAKLLAEAGAGGEASKSPARR